MSSTSDYEPDELVDQPTDDDIDDEEIYDAASFPVPKGKESPSFSSPPSTPISPLKRPRKSDADKQLPSSHKRLKRAYNDDYRKLYNEVVSEASDRWVVDTRQPLRQSQIGGSIWTPLEKAVFFDAVGKLGKDALPRIAAAVKTKSGVEVRDYVLLLQDGLLERRVNDQRQRLMAPWECPATIEISRECEERLEDAADALALQQGSWERAQEQEKYGEHWLLDGRIAADVEKLFDQGQDHRSYDEERYFGDSSPDDERESTGGRSELENPEGGILDAIPEAKLLKLANWITLSENIFMNPSEEHDMPNWHSIADKDERPGLLHTAFADFHALTVSVTRRIVQASLFQAMTRLRATEYTGTRSKPTVRRGDIHAVLNILGMQKNRRVYWIKVPQRCGLIVYRHPLVKKNVKRKHNPRLSYDRVEAFLASKERLKDFGAAPEHFEQDFASPVPAGAGVEGGNPDDVAELQSPVESAYEDDSEVEAHSDSEASNVPSPPLSPLLDSSQREMGHANSTKRQRLKMEQLTHTEEAYTERLDEHNSFAEELWLWALLGRSPPATTKTRADAVIEKGPGKPPIPQRKEADEIVEWRDWIDYEAEWEHFGDFNYVEDQEHDAIAGSLERDEQTRQESSLQSSDDDNEEQADPEDDTAAGAEDADVAGKHEEQSHSEQSYSESELDEETSLDQDEPRGVDVERESASGQSSSGIPEPHSSLHRQSQMTPQVQQAAYAFQDSAAGASDTDSDVDADASSS